MTELRATQIGTTRRTFLGKVIAAIMGFIGISLSIPLVGYVISPALKRRLISQVKVGSVSDLIPDHPVEMDTVIEVQEAWMKSKVTRAVWVVRKQETGELRVYNPLCTHLGCAYHWDSGDRLFKCPCHAGVYDINGNVISGPPPRPLDILEFHTEDSDLFVHYQDFKAGSLKKIPI